MVILLNGFLDQMRTSPGYARVRSFLGGYDAGTWDQRPFTIHESFSRLSPPYNSLGLVNIDAYNIDEFLTSLRSMLTKADGGKTLVPLEFYASRGPATQRLLEALVPSRVGAVNPVFRAFFTAAVGGLATFDMLRGMLSFKASLMTTSMAVPLGAVAWKSYLFRRLLNDAVDERDLVMARSVDNALNRSPERSILVTVGYMHVQSIATILERDYGMRTITVEDLENPQTDPLSTFLERKEHL